MRRKNTTGKNLLTLKDQGEAKPLAGSPAGNPTLYLNPKESDVMKQLKFYLDRRFDFRGWIHVPNETALSKLKALRNPQAYLNSLIAQGVKPGFPDILIFKSFCKREHLEDGDYLDHLKHGMAIEVKRDKGGRLSAGQNGWLEYLDSIGWATAVGYGYEDAINKIEDVYGKEIQ